MLHAHLSWHFSFRRIIRISHQQCDLFPECSIQTVSVFQLPLVSFSHSCDHSKGRFYIIAITLSVYELFIFTLSLLNSTIFLCCFAYWCNVVFYLVKFIRQFNFVHDGSSYWCFLADQFMQMEVFAWISYKTSGVLYMM